MKFPIIIFLKEDYHISAEIMSSHIKNAHEVREITRNLHEAISLSSRIRDHTSVDVVKACVLQLRVSALQALIFLQEQEYSIKKKDREALFKAYDRCRICILAKSTRYTFERDYTIPYRNKKDFLLGTRYIF